MKRALAERAKQSIPERAPSTTTSSPPEGQPPLKIARPTPSIVVSSTGNSGSNARTPRSPKPIKSTSAKRPRESNGSSSRPQQNEEGPVDETSAFYLKHQNRALATELKGWQQQCRELTSERDQRRRSCWRAVQALQSLQATWTTLETALGQAPPGVSVSSPKNTEASAPPSTPLVMGRKNEDDEVEMEDPALAIEWTGALHEALHNLAFPKNDTKRELAGASGDVGEDPHDVGELAANVASRASCLQDWLWKVLQAKRVSSDHLRRAKPEDADVFSECERWQHQSSELTRSRDYWRSQERRLRRNLYRLEAEIVTLPQVMHALERQDGTEDNLANEDAEIRATVQLERAAQAPPQEEKTDDKETDKVSSSVVEKLQQQIHQLEQEKKRRDQSIEELNQKIKDQGERINQLCVKQQSEDDIKRLESLETTVAELKAAEEKVASLEAELKVTSERWSTAQANETAVRTALEELREKHERRWKELSSTDEEVANGGGPEDAVTELKHKLQQALEHVRQAEDVRSNLADALDMNEKLKERLEEAKAASTDKEPGSKEESANASSTSSEKALSERAHDKLQREYRKLKDKYTLALASKENHKAKVERVEKERDSLMDTNARLMRQMAEKEEVNAKSLSSILHLKSMTEQLAEQRDNLEQQASSANQLALAARLASNAKDRVADELAKEKKAVEERLEKSEKELNDAKDELDDLKRDNSGKSSKHAALALELSNALKRCDELLAEAEAKREEIRRLVDSVDRAEREARESKEKLENLKKNTDGGAVSEFTVDQLTTQVSVLKSRLACPVCHYRDKGCIITKCGHLHCKQCVEERISNRSRKCPTCNQMFSKTDVTDVFLE